MNASEERHRRVPRLAGTVAAALALAAVTAFLLVRFDAFGGSSSSPARGTGAATSQERELPGFRSVELAGRNDVTISVGRRQSVVVYGDRAAIRHVTTAVVAGRLVIGNTRGGPASSSPMHVEISMPWLTALRLSGNGIITATNVTASPLTVSLTGDGIVKATGTATDVGVALAGFGDVELGHLVARNVTAALGGTGQISVYARESLRASLSGSGVIEYFGHPARLATEITGTGAITPLEL